MDALTKVFATIMDVLNIIKKFFEDIFALAPKAEEEGDAEANPEA